MQLKMSSAKWRLFRLSLNELMLPHRQWDFFRWHFMKNAKLFFRENAFEKFFRKMSAILFGPQYTKCSPLSAQRISCIFSWQGAFLHTQQGKQHHQHKTTISILCKNNFLERKSILRRESDNMMLRCLSYDQLKRVFEITGTKNTRLDYNGTPQKNNPPIYITDCVTNLDLYTLVCWDIYIKFQLWKSGDWLLEFRCSHNRSICICKYWFIWTCKFNQI